VRLFGSWVFTELGLLRLRIDSENDASHAVAVRAGYQREGITRSAHVVVSGPFMRRSPKLVFGHASKLGFEHG
jgi:RimJ/RimL family protein N-acetyltransferase